MWRDVLMITVRPRLNIPSPEDNGTRGYVLPGDRKMQ